MKKAENDILTTRYVNYSFNLKEELDSVKKFTLLKYAEEYLKYLGEIGFNKCCNINSDFWANYWTIKVDVTRRVLGLKITKHYIFELDQNKVYQAEDVGGDGNYTYIRKREVQSLRNSCDSFLGYLASRLRDQTKDYNIEENVKEYRIIPGVNI